MRTYNIYYVRDYDKARMIRILTAPDFETAEILAFICLCGWFVTAVIEL